VLLNCFGELFPLSDVPLDDTNNKDEAQHRGEIVEDPKPRVDIPRGAIIMKQDTHGDETVADFPAEENRACDKREGIEVDKRD
jgi:hypothetical protein